MKIYLMTIGIILATVVAPVACTAGEEFPSEMSTRYPAAFTSWQKIVPDNLKRLPWLSLFRGVESPLEEVYNGKRRGFWGSVCKPRDCGDNQIIFLIAEDGLEAYGLVRSAEASDRRDLFLGNPDETVRGLLLERMQEAAEGIAARIDTPQCDRDLRDAGQLSDAVHDKEVRLNQARQEHDRQRWCQLDREILESASKASELMKRCALPEQIGCPAPCELYRGLDQKMYAELDDKMLDMDMKIGPASGGLKINCR